MNRALKEQLVTTQHSDPGSGSSNVAAHSHQWQDSMGEEEEEGERDEEDGVESSETERQQSDSSIEHLPEHRLMVSPQASLSLNVIECGGGEDEAKYYPPKKSPP